MFTISISIAIIIRAIPKNSTVEYKATVKNDLNITMKLSLNPNLDLMDGIHINPMRIINNRTVVFTACSELKFLIQNSTVR